MGRYSNDPVQNAEMASEHAAEMRMTGIRSYWDEREPDDEPGEDYGPDEEEEANYAVLPRLANGEWDDCWAVDGEPARFASWAEAEAEITEFLEDSDDAALDYTRADFRIVPVQEA